jgi:hypothetical protein
LHLALRKKKPAKLLFSFAKDQRYSEINEEARPMKPDISADVVRTDLSKAPTAPNQSDPIVVKEVQPPTKPRKSRRSDSGKTHRVRHGILSCEILDALVQLGEDRRTFRRLERQYRTALQPTGPIGNIIFDRFWSSYLRLILIGRLETQQFVRKSLGERKSISLALVPGHQPTLVCQDPIDQPSESIPLAEELPSDLFRRLALAQRYDRHFSREMYRSLALLLLMRRGGEAALESWASEMFGAEQPRKEE